MDITFFATFHPTTKGGMPHLFFNRASVEKIREPTLAKEEKQWATGKSATIH
jgi:hypothetical protein